MRSQASSRRADSVRVAFQQLWPSFWSASAPLALPQPLDLKWLATTVKAGPLPARKVCASGGRLRVPNRSSVSVAAVPTGDTREAR